MSIHEYRANSLNLNDVHDFWEKNPHILMRYDQGVMRKVHAIDLPTHEKNIKDSKKQGSMPAPKQIKSPVVFHSKLKPIMKF